MQCADCCTCAAARLDSNQLPLHAAHVPVCQTAVPLVTHACDCVELEPAGLSGISMAAAITWSIWQAAGLWSK